MVSPLQEGGCRRSEGDAVVLELSGLETVVRLRTGTVRAVDGVSLTVRRGETVGLVGESGSGKTMTGMSVVQLLPPGGEIVGGEVNFLGRDLRCASRAELRRIRGSEIGVIFQDPMTSLDPTMPIGRQVGEVWRLHRGGSRTEALARAEEVLGRVGLPNPSQRLGTFPHQLSGGLRQRVMIAMALVCEPKLIIADEPTTALDVTIQAQILDLLQQLKVELDVAVLLITHDMGVVANHTDRVAVMYAGRVVEEAGTAELFRHPRHRYSQALLGSIPKLSQDRSRRLYAIGGLPPDLSVPIEGCRFVPRCQFAGSDCVAGEPPFTGMSTHRFACWHPAPDDGAPGEVGRLAIVEESGEAPALVVCEGLTKEFPLGRGLVPGRRGRVVKAVSNVTMSIRAGETFGLVGESVCGKTTLAHMIVGLEAATAGRIAYDGVEVGTAGHRDRARLRRELQLMFQDPYSSLDPRMKVGSIIAEPLRAQHSGGLTSRRARVLEVLDQVGLPSSAVDRYPHEFSGGQRQRIGLARSLALRPKLIVADEPVSALDVSIRSQILNLMRELQVDHGLTYLVISHDLSVVRYLADRIGVMYLGRLVEVGQGDDIYERPAHPYTSALLASLPSADLAGGGELGATAAKIGGELPSAIDPPSGCHFRTRCPRAEGICARVEPPYTPLGGEHQVACHFPLQVPVSVSVPTEEGN